MGVKGKEYIYTSIKTQYKTLKDFLILFDIFDKMLYFIIFLFLIINLYVYFKYQGFIYV